MLAVVPTGLHVDLPMIQLASGKHGLRIASEGDIVRQFGSPELGGSAAFDGRCGTPVYLDDSFGGRQHIYFPDGSNKGVLALRLRDYIRLARPIVGAFGTTASHRTVGRG